MSSHSFHHPQEILLAQFSLHVHKGGLKPDSFHFFAVAGRGVCKVDWSDYYSGHKVDSLARLVAHRHPDVKDGGSIPVMGSFNNP